MGALEAEAKVFEAGLLLARDIGIQDVILEGESLVIYNALCESSLPPFISSFGCVGDARFVQGV